jgi:enoyl-CoA hydratase
MRRSVPVLSSSITSSILGTSRKIVLNRPKMMNVLNIEMCQDIKQLLTEYKEDPSVSAILMRGEGDKAFCAGKI